MSVVACERSEGVDLENADVSLDPRPTAKDDEKRKSPFSIITNPNNGLKGLRYQ
jgi:hypothetical protein